jgi:hypothetical protein
MMILKSLAIEFQVADISAPGKQFIPELFIPPTFHP